MFKYSLCSFEYSSPELEPELAIEFVPVLHLLGVVVGDGVPVDHLVVGGLAQLERRERIHAHEQEEGGGGARAPEVLLVVHEVGSQEHGQGFQVDRLRVGAGHSQTGLRHFDDDY
jgi:hypothetical protein